jgi:hypothetical protein
MPTEPTPPTPSQFQTASSLLSWIRVRVYAARADGKEPVKVTLPVWAEGIFASLKREEIGDTALAIMKAGVRPSFTQLFGVTLEWDAENLAVVLPPEE